MAIGKPCKAASFLAPYTEPEQQHSQQGTAQAGHTCCKVVGTQVILDKQLQQQVPGILSMVVAA